ncbi:DUF177 domain-containing protein [Siccirubricoccus sp. KC 17139]|uniref:DUF177 domain-containing protein n=1 Tax=Siccirubricoccus soli TaxID=2899147 RepID=A0ABT1D6Z3_9PROT|nr:DUF177 domain-containing protein [Siccirubricoccus soli]MCO6417698.1 DUF177 domain-containing protein [Siccirubricoccus soli]MCP2683833.1 DUF177 domain-containing protein [Siccirubricoccus soli]
MPPEFSRRLPLGLVGPGGRTESLAATPEECAALAARFHLLGIDSLAAELRLRPDSDGAVLAEGALTAEVTQACVVTLEPVPQRVEARLAFRLLSPGQEESDGPEDLDEIACPDGVADLGEAVAEQLALALDPYPRAPGAELPPEATESETGPFAALGRLKRPN